MALNPISFPEQVVAGFLRYQPTTCPPADQDLTPRCGPGCVWRKTASCRYGAGRSSVSPAGPRYCCAFVTISSISVGMFPPWNS